MEKADTTIAKVHPAGVVAPRATLWTVQVLRAAAALMVVAGHGQSAVEGVMRAAGGTFTRSTILPWGASVDLFFGISGFIIVHSSGRLFGTKQAVREFLRRRLARIVPLYWLVTTAFLLLLGIASMKGGDPFPPASAILGSYAFLPVDAHATGKLFPVFDLGWTLNYEMFFYALLASVIALPRRTALVTAGLAICALVLIGETLPGPSMTWFWTRPILIDFALGGVVSVLLTAQIRVATWLRVAMAVAAVLILAADPGHVFDGPAGMTVDNGWPRVLLAGVPVAILLAAAVLGPEPRMPRAALPFTRIGDASYSLYLLHPFALIAMEKLAQKFGVAHAAPGWAIVWATIAASIALALAGYRWVESPMTAAIARRLRPRDPPSRSVRTIEERPC